ncbi:hypothetical protein DL89DRAFT_270250 [Linderina pennispora]|uniref:Endonuclease/exonuclease/phosphatase domain-containing protein n=1 Tax=Linderina pennispora TaxID=61395 RepID=A0A1Y1VYJ3_9FUNG|nr:uncharacterized protein DL89DRAFT_270250 [Linderina pennispora]ORX66323.1 hypothetical protein DL89DRAFT_270250 [Linderina pennispora]
MGNRNNGGAGRSSRSLTRSLMYVAFSRAVSASGLYLIGDFREPSPPDRNSSLQREYARQQQCQLLPVFRFLREPRQCQQLLFHNVQSLRAHLQLVTSDKVYMHSDLLLFAETWLCEDQSCEIPGFTMVASASRGSHGSSAVGACCYVSERLQSLVHGVMAGIQRFGRQSVSVAAATIRGTRFISMYASPGTRVEQITSTIAPYFSETSMHYVLACDINIDLRKNGEQQRQIQALLNNYNLRMTTPSDSYSTRAGTRIDYIFTTLSNTEAGAYTTVSKSFHYPLWLRFNFCDEVLLS